MHATLLTHPPKPATVTPATRDPTLQAKEELEAAARAERETEAAAQRSAEAAEAAAARREAEACRAAAAAAEAAAARRAELAALRTREEAERSAEAERRFRRCGGS